MVPASDVPLKQHRRPGVNTRFEKTSHFLQCTRFQGKIVIFQWVQRAPRTPFRTVISDCLFALPALIVPRLLPNLLNQRIAASEGNGCSRNCAERASLDALNAGKQLQKPALNGFLRRQKRLPE